ncbi:MAG: chitobiase/beta-hexosaminidase C-terminal domain-containing protein, partial [Muribaculaceae bacterium]
MGKKLSLLLLLFMVTCYGHAQESFFTGFNGSSIGGTDDITPNRWSITSSGSSLNTIVYQTASPSLRLETGASLITSQYNYISSLTFYASASTPTTLEIYYRIDKREKWDIVTTESEFKGCEKKKMELRTIDVSKLRGLKGVQLKFILSAGVISIDDITIKYGIPVASTTMPTFTPNTGTYYETQNIALNCTTEGASIFYTKDGTQPSSSSSPYIAGSAITVDKFMTIKAIAIKDGINSDIAEATYTILNPATDIESKFTFVGTDGKTIGTINDAYNNINIKTQLGEASDLVPVYYNNTMLFYHGNHIVIAPISNNFIITEILIQFTTGSLLSFNGTDFKVTANQIKWTGVENKVTIINPKEKKAVITDITVKYRKIINVTTNLATILDGGVDNVYYEIGLPLQGICADGGYLYAKTENGLCSHISK